MTPWKSPQQHVDCLRLSRLREPTWEAGNRELSLRSPSGKIHRASPVAQLVKNPPAMWETWIWSQDWEDPLEKGKATTPIFCPGEGKGYPFLYSGLENSVDCIVHGVAKSWTRLSDFHFHFLSSDISSTICSNLTKGQIIPWGNRFLDLQ